MTVRVVPVTLQVGKSYVLMNGNVGKCEANPHHWNAHVDPFVLKGGEGKLDWVAYCTADGTCASPEYSAARPVYAEGERYVTRDGTVVTIDEDDNDSYYPLNAEGVACWTREGKEWQNNDSHMDLMDYLPAIPVVQQPDPPVDRWIGKRVRFMFDGYSGAGVVVGWCDANMQYAVKMDEQYAFGHTCDGLVTRDHGGWFVRAEALVLDEPKREPHKMDEFIKAVADVPFEKLKLFDALPPWQRGVVKALGSKADVVIVDDAEKVTLPECVPVGADTANIGRRVAVKVLAWKGDHTEFFGTIRAVKDSIYYAVEFDAYMDTCWDCTGLVPSKQGKFIRYDTDDWRFADILERPLMAATCAVPECAAGFSELDRAEVWATFRAVLETPISVNIPALMNELIAARKKLNTA